MRLRTRLGLAALALTTAMVLGFGAVGYSAFVEQQERQMKAVLAQDLARITDLLANPALGETFVSDEVSGTVMQLVSPAGQVVIDLAGGYQLPETETPSLVELGGRSFLVATGPWTATGGTLRLGHDVGTLLSVRRDLLESLLLAGIVVALLAAAIALIGADRMLAPLARVAEQAKSVDPSTPRGVDYDGPADEIGDLVAALNTSLDAIGDHQEAEHRFLLEVAHELAAPLTLVNYHLGALKRDHPDDPRLRAAAAGTQELLRTSQDLLVVARGELERPIDASVVDMLDVVNGVLDEYPGVRSEAEGPVEVIGDHERLRQVVRNLVRNALQATGRPERVNVVVREAGPDAIVTVEDDGPGMSPETAARVFDHGYTGGSGIGVGLTVCRKLVERHGGTVGVTSELGKGSVFEVRLPTVASRLESPLEDGHTA